MLQSQCMRKLREELRYADASRLAEVLHSPCIPAQLKYFPPEFDAASIVRRDALAFALCRYAILQDGEVYGGFVREMLSGLHWKDVDLCFLHRKAIVRFKQTLGSFLELVFRIPAATIRRVLLDIVRCPEYGHTVHRHQLRWENMAVQVDITHIAARSLASHLPGTLGSSLTWDHSGLRWRSLDCDPSSRLMEVNEIVRLLRDGHDVQRFPTLGEWLRMDSSDARTMVMLYCTSKKEELEGRGYTMKYAHGVPLQDVMDVVGIA